MPRPKLKVLDGQPWEAPTRMTLTVEQGPLDGDLAHWDAARKVLVVSDTCTAEDHVHAISDFVRLVWAGRGAHYRPVREPVRALP